MQRSTIDAAQHGEKNVRRASSPSAASGNAGIAKYCATMTYIARIIGGN
jgi:hypothetical protein